MLGQEVNEYISDQFNVRQELYSNTNSRSKNQIQLLNNQNAWIKMASGVALEIDENKNLSPFAKEKLKNIEIPEGSLENYKGKLLAEKFVLFNGVSSLSNNWSGLRNKKGFNTSNFLNSDGSYSKSDFGYVPMPGITGFDIKSLNRGSIKKATIKFKLHSKDQFDIFELLYLRLGYTVLVEFGNNIYADSNSLTTQKIGQTLIEDKENGFFSDKFTSGGSYLSILDEIEKLRSTYSGNYGGFLGKIVNFEWSIDNLGSYDVTLNLISLGDVIESFKINTPINQSFKDILLAAIGQSDKLPENFSINNSISAMLWAFKWVNRSVQGEKVYQISNSNEGGYTESNNKNQLGFLMNTGDDSLLVPQTTITFTVGPESGYQYSAGGVTRRRNFPKKSYTKTYSYEERVNKKYKKDDANFRWQYLVDNFKTDIDEKLAKSTADRKYKKLTTFQSWKTEEIEIKNPLGLFDVNGKDGFMTSQKNPNYYIRLGALLNYIQNTLIPILASPDKIENTPIIRINYDPKGPEAAMYTMPNQLSLDPNICIVKNTVTFPANISSVKSNYSAGDYFEFYDKLEPFSEIDFSDEDKQEFGLTAGKDGPPLPSNPNRAYISNIYLNHKFIEDTLSGKIDDKGDISLYALLDEICKNVNRALGGINNLEPVIDETLNLLSIIDTTPIPGQIQLTPDPPYTLNLFGFDSKGKGNFIRKLDIKTTISPEYASMITIGSTAAGYVKGTNGTAFSKWNKGLVDRFKEQYVPPDTTLVETSGSFTPSPTEASEQYLLDYLGKKSYEIIGATYTTDRIQTQDYNQKHIEQNISTVTEFYKFAQAKKSLENMDSDGVAGGIGFIPFKMSFTMNGIEGVKIYNTLHINSSFLPQAYGKTLDFIITGVDHSIKSNDWETTINTLVQPKSTTPDGSTVISSYNYLYIPEVLEVIEGSSTPKIPGVNDVLLKYNIKPPTNTLENPKGWPYYAPGGTSTVPKEVENPQFSGPNTTYKGRSNPPRNNFKVSATSELRNEYLPILNKKIKSLKGLKILALAMTSREGFRKDTRSYKYNNPGNIGNTDSGANQGFTSLKAGTLAQLRYLLKVSKGEHKAYPLNKLKDIKPFYSKEIARNSQNYQLTPYLPGYKFTYTGKLSQFIKIYSTGARAGNNYLSEIISLYKKNGFTVSENTTLRELVTLKGKSDVVI
jgi:hypothetical protein